MVQVRATLRVAGMFPGTKQAYGNFRMEITTYFLYLTGSNLPDIVYVFLCFVLLCCREDSVMGHKAAA